jgi:uncharacterized protein YbbC (DUF1343 family)
VWCSTAEPGERLAGRGDPRSDKDSASFVGYFPPMPIRHGMTLGELARLSTARTTRRRSQRRRDEELAA